jgi:hypothetical protein
MKYNFILLLLLIAIINTSFAEKSKNEQIQRAPAGILDNQANTISNINFMSGNNGILFLNQTQNTGTGYWPRGSINQYMFGGGIWFACQKTIDSSQIIDNGDGTYDTTTVSYLNKLCSISYDPNSGSSWMVPGRIEDGNEVIKTDNWKYRIYFSTDFDASGKPKMAFDKYYWPIWNDDTHNALGLGSYIQDIESRKVDNYPKGPFYKSDEDIFTTFKDTDLAAYLDTFKIREAQGYPLGLQYEQTILSWKSEDYKDMTIIFYKITNMSQDTLRNCFVAPIYDMDLALSTNASPGAGNDRAKFYTDDRSLNLGVAWTRSDQGEYGRGFGYLGISFIMTPAVDGNQRLMMPEDYFDKDNQIGLITFRNWSIEEDLKDDSTRFDFVVSGTIDENTIPGDRRMLFSSGPFDMYPGETAYLATQINIAKSLSDWEASGEVEDMQILIDKVRQGQNFFNDKIMNKFEDFANNQLDFQLYPNPSKDFVQIKHNFQNRVNIVIYDILGRKILQEQIENSKNVIIELDLSEFPPANYIICISDNNTLISKNLVLTK